MAAIEFSPPLPPARDLLQDRWISQHNQKYVVVYDTPFWRAEGLSGNVIGAPPADYVFEVTPVSGVVECKSRANSENDWTSTPPL